MGRRTTRKDGDKPWAVKASPQSHLMLDEMCRAGIGRHKDELTDKAIKWFYLTFAPASPLVANDPQSETGDVS